MKSKEMKTIKIGVTALEGEIFARVNGKNKILKIFSKHDQWNEFVFEREEDRTLQIFRVGRKLKANRFLAFQGLNKDF